MKRELVAPSIALTGIITKNCNITDLENVSENDLENTFLPYAYMTQEKDVNPYHLMIKGDRNIYPEAPFFMSFFFARPKIRRLEGSRYVDHSLLKFSPKHKGETNEKYKELLDVEDDDNVQLGHSLFVVIYNREDFCQFVTIDAFGAGAGYWANPLKEGKFSDKKAIKIFIADHSCNLATSKKGFDYLASYNFKDWAPEDILDVDYQRILEQSKSQDEQIRNYLDR